MAFLQGLIGIVGVDIFRCNSSSFSYSAYMYAVMKICILTYRGISGVAFHEKKKNDMPLCFSFIRIRTQLTLSHGRLRH